MLFPLFILCYLPPRLLFFVEDGREGRTWKRILALSFALWTARYFLP
ncbi:MAG: hypothetical protein J0L75_14235 [Spirochaetes bacterium]|nr:hypothetical protein [Spirochaetota bacterium]